MPYPPNNVFASNVPFDVWKLTKISANINVNDENNDSINNFFVPLYTNTIETKKKYTGLYGTNHGSTDE